MGERLDRTQEVGGSSPPSSIPKHTRTRTVGDAGLDDIAIRRPIGRFEATLTLRARECGTLPDSIPAGAAGARGGPQSHA
jgi:hypothetical protein